MLLINYAPPIASNSFITIILWNNMYKSGIFIFGTSMELPIGMRFEGGHHNISKIGEVSKYRKYAQVNIQMQKTAIWDKNTTIR